MRKQPIMEFKNIKQAVKYLKWWQKKLFLTDWIIKVKLVPVDEMPDTELQGNTTFTYSQHSAVVRITELTKDHKSRIVKACQEQTLVHELLHLKYNILDSNKTYEGEYLDCQEHALLEQMAKTLIMVKYGLNYKWFKNFKE